MVSYIFFHLFPSAEMSVYPQAGPSGAFVFGPAAASPVSAIPNATFHLVYIVKIYIIYTYNYLDVFGPSVDYAHG